MHKQLWIGLLLGVIAHAASGASVQSQPSAGSVQGGATDDIVFAGKLFTDLPDYGSIAISGTLTGDGIGYKNNTISISCYKDRRECYIAHVEQIGSNQIGRMQEVDFFPIMKWNADEVVAVEDITELNCARTTIVVDRKSKTAQYVREPVNKTRPRCLKFPDPKVYKWTVEDSPGWKEIFGKK
jgi:hypothetical protein